MNASLKRCLLLVPLYLLGTNVYGYQRPTLPSDEFIGRPAPAALANLQVDVWLPSAINPHAQKPDTKGKFVLIDFWASWCQPCLMFFPALNTLQDQFKSDLVVISLDEEPDKSPAFIQHVVKTSLGEPHFYEGIDRSRRVVDSIHGVAYPLAALMSPDGVIQWIGPALSYEPSKGYFTDLDVRIKSAMARHKRPSKKP